MIVYVFSHRKQKLTDPPLDANDLFARKATFLLQVYLS